MKNAFLFLGVALLMTSCHVKTAYMIDVGVCDFYRVYCPFCDEGPEHSAEVVEEATCS